MGSYASHKTHSAELKDYWSQRLDLEYHLFRIATLQGQGKAIRASLCTAGIGCVMNSRLFLGD